MEDNISDYVEDGIEIHEEVFNKDFDDVSWDPIEVDDSDEDSAREYGY